MSASRALPLRLGPLSVPGRTVLRSGVRWLREDGAHCDAGEPVGYCNLALPEGNMPVTSGLFPGNQRDLQIAIASPVAGRLHLPPPERGGFGDLLSSMPWREDANVATVEVDGDAGADAQALEARLVMLAGERMTEIAEVRHGLATGWHGMVRAAHVGPTPPPATLLSMGICEIEPVLKGARHAFLELMQETRGPAHVVLVPDQVIVPGVRVIREQLLRTPEERAAIEASLRDFIAGSQGNPEPEGWFMAAALLKTLTQSPVTQGHDLLYRGGAVHAALPQALLVSLHAERALTLRHRRLGYTLAFHRFRLADCGAVFRRWLQANFEIVARSANDIARDYEELIGVLRERAPQTRLLVSNILSTSGRDDVQCYQGVDLRHAGSLARKLNQSLAEVAQQLDIGVLDVDAVAAEVGIGRHSTDGVHHDAVMAAAMRRELVAVLTGQGLPGFV